MSYGIGEIIPHFELGILNSVFIPFCISWRSYVFWVKRIDTTTCFSSVIFVTSKNIKERQLVWWVIPMEVELKDNDKRNKPDSANINQIVQTFWPIIACRIETESLNHIVSVCEDFLEGRTCKHDSFLKVFVQSLKRSWQTAFKTLHTKHAHANANCLLKFLMSFV